MIGFQANDDDDDDDNDNNNFAIGMEWSGSGKLKKDGAFEGGGGINKFLLFPPFWRKKRKRKGKEKGKKVES